MSSGRLRREIHAQQRGKSRDNISRRAWLRELGLTRNAGRGRRRRQLGAVLVPVHPAIAASRERAS